MSSPSRPSLFTGSKSGIAGKKRRPNFRPTGNRTSKSASSNPSAKPVSGKQPPREAIVEADYSKDESPGKETEDVDVSPPEAEATADSLEAPETKQEQQSATPESPRSPHKKQAAQAIATSDAPDAVNDDQTSSAMKKLPRKRRKVGVPVGATRVTTTEPPSITNETLDRTGDAEAAAPSKTAVGPSVIEAGTVKAAGVAGLVVDDSAPTLASFCSKFRVKRKRGEKNAPSIAKPRKESNASIPPEVVPVAEAPSAPQVQVINGEIVLNESSIIVAGTTAADKEADMEEYTVVEEEAQLAVIGASYNSFVPRRAPQHWSVEDTKRFYDALRQVGTDFGTMEAYFDKKRTRKQLKRKFQVESAKNPHLIDNALNVQCMKEIDMSVFNITEEDKAVVEKAAEERRAKEALNVECEAISESSPEPADLSSSVQGRGSKTSRVSEEVSRNKIVIDDFFADMKHPDQDGEDQPVDDPLLMPHDALADETAEPIVNSHKRNLRKPKFKAKARAVPRRK